MTPRQAAFVQEYLIDKNATQAAIRAGYSAKTAKEQGHRLLTYAHITAAVAKGQAERTERVQVSQDYVLQRLMMEAEREGEGSSHSARVQAITALGKHLAMFTDKQEVSADVRVSGIEVGFVKPRPAP